MVKLVDQLKHDAKKHQRDITPDIISLLTNEDLKNKSALVKHVCLNGHRIDLESSTTLPIKSELKKTVFRIILYTQN